MVDPPLVHPGRGGLRSVVNGTEGRYAKFLTTIMPSAALGAEVIAFEALACRPTSGVIGIGTRDRQAPPSVVICSGTWAGLVVRTRSIREVLKQRPVRARQEEVETSRWGSRIRRDHQERIPW